MIKKLSAYIGEYMAATILTPLMVTLEAVMEILIQIGRASCRERV